MEENQLSPLVRRKIDTGFSILKNKRLLFAVNGNGSFAGSVSLRENHFFIFH
jgi:hypothetical protein